MSEGTARRGGAAGWRVGLVAAALPVALVSLWLHYLLKEEAEVWQGDDPSDAPSGGDSAPTAQAAVPGEQEQPQLGPGGIAVCAVAGAVLLLALWLLGRRWAKGSVTTAARKHRKTLAADLGALLQSGRSSDVTFVVGDRQLRAHRALLVARSPVFAAMMTHDFLEADSGRVVVTDVEVGVMQHLLEFLYTDEVQLADDRTAQKLLVAADKYQMATLKEQCESAIAHNLTVQNAAACAVLASRHSCSCLREAAARFIAAHFQQVMATTGWAEAVRDHPQHVVEVSRLVAAAGTGAPAADAVTPGTVASVQPENGVRVVRRQTETRRQRENAQQQDGGIHGIHGFFSEAFLLSIGQRR